MSKPALEAWVGGTFIGRRRLGEPTDLMAYYAHSVSGRPEVEWEPLARHLHLSDARKSMETRDRANHTDSEIKQVMDGLEAHTPFPTTLSLDDQGRFVVGFYHQRPVRRAAKAAAETPTDAQKE